MLRRAPGVVVLDAQLGGEHAIFRQRLEGICALRVAAGSDDCSGSHKAGHGVVQAWHSCCGACYSERSSAKRVAAPARHSTIFKKPVHGQADGFLHGRQVSDDASAFYVAFAAAGMLDDDVTLHGCYVPQLLAALCHSWKRMQQGPVAVGCAAFVLGCAPVTKRRGVAVVLSRSTCSCGLMAE